jgi:capsular exopolysaccharide synthesis family protein
MQNNNYVKATIGNMPELPYAIEEAVNRLRVNISFLGTDIRKIMVISTTPDEGKSFVTMQLWRQLAASGIQTALVDMDLRKSVMVDKYDIKRDDGKKILGTSYYLANEMPMEKVLLHTNIGEGVILPNVDNVVNPSMLLESKKLELTLNELADEFRYVILDCPPLDMVSDGERIGSLCDGAILVARGGVTPKSMIKNSIRQLERANCPLLGVVLNRVKGSGSGYYYKQYGGKYGYYGKSGYYYN